MRQGDRAQRVRPGEHSGGGERDVDRRRRRRIGHRHRHRLSGGWKWTKTFDKSIMDSRVAIVGDVVLGTDWTPRSVGAPPDRRVRNHDPDRRRLRERDRGRPRRGIRGGCPGRARRPDPTLAAKRMNAPKRSPDARRAPDPSATLGPVTHPPAHQTKPVREPEVAPTAIRSRRSLGRKSKPFREERPWPS